MAVINKKLGVVILAMMMVLGGMAGGLVSGGAQAYADAATQTITDANITHVEVSIDHKTVTLTTNRYMELQDGVAGSDAVLVARDGSAFQSVADDSSANTVQVSADSDFNQTRFTLTFDSPLMGTVNKIQIAGLNFELQPDDPYDGTATTQPLELPVLHQTGAKTDWYQNSFEIYLNFDQMLIANNDSDVSEISDEDYVRSGLSISTDGEQYTPIPDFMYVDYYDSTINLYYDGSLQRAVTFGPNARIKIAAGTFAGQPNEDLILDVSQPTIRNAAISDDHKTVTVTFDRTISDQTDGELKSHVFLLKGGAGSPLTALTEGDSASIVDGKLVVAFDQALVGDHNQLVIDPYTLKDANGNVNGYSMMTTFLNGAVGVVDTAPPALLNYYVSADGKELTFVYDEDVYNNRSSLDDFIESVNCNRQNYWESCSPSSVQFTDNKLIVQLNTALEQGTYIQFNFNSAIKDASGNAANGNYIYIVYPPYVDISQGYLTHNGHYMNLYFNTGIVDNTLVNGVSSLKDKIKVSTDQGDLLPLADNDVVTVQDGHLVVIFHDAKSSGNVHVHVDAGALAAQSAPFMHNESSDTQILNYTPDVSGYLFSNAASEFVIGDTAWTSKVREVKLVDEDTVANGYAERTLDPSEYTLNAGKLTLQQGLFQEGHAYEIILFADGYNYVDISRRAFDSTQLVYVTAPVISKQGGIQAKVNVLRNWNVSTDWRSTQAVVFELMDGTTPVSIVAGEFNVQTGAYSAQFNVADYATNSNYSVKAFVVSSFDSDLTHVGVNLSTQVTQDQYELLLNEQLMND